MLFCAARNDGGASTVNIPQGIKDISIYLVTVNIDGTTRGQNPSVSGTIISETKPFTSHYSHNVLGKNMSGFSAEHIKLTGAAGTINIQYQNIGGQTDIGNWFVVANK